MIFVLLSLKHSPLNWSLILVALFVDKRVFGMGVFFLSKLLFQKTKLQFEI